jgi:hypothetical protein
MAPKRVIRKSDQPHEPGYPSLRSHLTTRRRFLEVAGVAVAAGGLATACGRALGNEGEPDASTPAPGGDPGPDYYTLRIPDEADLYAYLIDGGSAQFYVELVTYRHDSFQALLDHFDDASSRARSTVQEYTYDSLSTAPGLIAAEDDLHEAMDALVMELNAHGEATIEALTLHITYLDSEPIMMGDAPFPSYP